MLSRENALRQFQELLAVTFIWLFDPSAIAVVGASKTEGKIGYEAMANTTEFDGPVYPVDTGRPMSAFDDFITAVAEDEATESCSCMNCSSSRSASPSIRSTASQTAGGRDPERPVRLHRDL